MYYFSNIILQCGAILLLGRIMVEGNLAPGEDSLATRAQQKQGQKQGQKYVPLSVMNCPVLQNASCMTGGDASTTCNCDSLKKTDTNKRRKGEYSCPSGKCQYCASKYGNCKIDGFNFPCCDSTLSCVNAKGFDYACFTECNARRIYETCKDSSTSRSFTRYYTSCKGKAPNTFVECPDLSPDSTVKPVECSTTGGKCRFYDLKDDGCCNEFACAESGKCEAECKEGDDKCKPRINKYRCYKEVRTVSCMDSDKRVFTARYLGCKAQDPVANPNNFFECAGQTTTVRECGATGAKCEQGTYFTDTCCTNFVCVSGVCKPECAANAQNCTPDTTKKKKAQSQTE